MRISDWSSDVCSSDLTTHLLASVLEHHGWPTAVIGTLSGPRTTPEAPELQALLAAEVAAGRQAVSMAVSSHALTLGRSAERRVGKEWVSTCRCRGAPYP